MKRQFVSVLLFSAILVGGGTTFVSCTDHESDAAYIAQGSIADALNSQAEKLNSEITKLKEIIGSENDENSLKWQVAQLQNKLNAATGTDIPAIKGDIAQAQADITALERRIAAAETAIEEAKQAAKDYTDEKVAAAQQELQQKISDLESQISTCHTDCKAYTDSQVEALNEIINGLDDQMASYAQSIQQLYNLYSDLYAYADRDSILIAQIEEKKADWDDVKAGLAAKVDTTDFNAAKAQIEANKALCEQNKADIDALNDKILDFVTKTELDNKASELQDAFEAADKALKDEIQGKIDSLQTQLNTMFNAMVNMITGIELQATESPITGYENLSFLGAEAHILGAYYGTAIDGDVQLNGETVIQGNNEILIDTESGENAGVVYATINPSNVDFTGTTLKIVDSQGNEAPFTATVVKTDKVLTYGFSRAGKSNLYAVKINLTPENIEAAKTWTSSDVSDVKEVAKNVLDKLRKPSTTRLNLKDAASTVVNLLNNRLTAYALEAEQEVTDGKNKETRTITSKMSLAATAIKPVSYQFLKDNQTLKNLDLPSFPTIQSKINFNDYKFNWTPIEGLGTVKTSVTLKGMPDLENIKVTIDGEVKAPVVNVEKATVTFGETTLTGYVDSVTGKVTIDLTELQQNTTADVKVSVGNVKINPEDVKITLDTSAKTDMSYDVEIPMDEFNKIINSINSQVGNMIGNVNDIVDVVKGYSDIIDNNYIGRINTFIQKFENLLRKSNSLLQPAMFYTASDGSYGQLARESEGATFLKLNGGTASTVFIASSYTAELLAPAYKKCIYVSSKPAGATVSGENLGKVVSGDTRKIGFQANKAGIYELTYEAVDYSGVKVSKKFYVKVVE